MSSVVDPEDAHDAMSSGSSGIGSGDMFDPNDFDFDLDSEIGEEDFELKELLAAPPMWPDLPLLKSYAEEFPEVAEQLRISARNSELAFERECAETIKHEGGYFVKRLNQAHIMQDKLDQDNLRTNLTYDDDLDKDWIVRQMKIKWLKNIRFVTEREIEYRGDPEIVIVQWDTIYDYFKILEMRFDSEQLLKEMKSLPPCQWFSGTPPIDIIPGKGHSMRVVTAPPAHVPFDEVPVDPKVENEADPGNAVEPAKHELWFARGYNYYCHEAVRRILSDEWSTDLVATLRRGLRIVSHRGSQWTSTFRSFLRRWRPAARRIRKRVIATGRTWRKTASKRGRQLGERVWSYRPWTETRRGSGSATEEDTDTEIKPVPARVQEIGRAWDELLPLS